MKQELIDALIGISGKDYVFFAHEDIEGYLYDCLLYTSRCV